MGRGKVGEYDDGKLVEMLAGGQYTYAEIGEALGLTEGHVGRIARGERRPRVMAEVRARVEAALAQARRVGARWCRALMERHVEVGLQGRGETARKCREFVLSRLDLTRPAPRVEGRRRGREAARKVGLRPSLPSPSKTHGPQSVGFGAAAGAEATETRADPLPTDVGLPPPAEAPMEGWVAEMVKAQGPRPRPRRRRKGQHPNFVQLGVS